MKELFQKAIECEDAQVKNSIIRILAENCELGMSGASFFETCREVSSELGDCHFDKDMAMLYLSLTSCLPYKDSALDNYCTIDKSAGITRWDFCVLWAEMIKKHGEKIRHWFPKISEIDFEGKILDECRNFLTKGGKPFYDITV